MGFELRKVDVCRVYLETLEAEREKFSEKKRNFFKSSIAEALGRPVSVFNRSEYEVHHLVPLSLGGKNNYDNLCLLPIKDHEWVHRKIFRQVENLNFGEQATIDIPFPTRPYVWNMEDFVNEENFDAFLVREGWAFRLERDWMAPLREELSVYSTANTGRGEGAAAPFKL